MSLIDLLGVNLLCNWSKVLSDFDALYFDNPFEGVLLHGSSVGGLFGQVKE
jgi:hypothetical protein